MPLEIFYFRDEHGHSAVEEQLKSLRPKAFARSLAYIDLLESGERLPAKLEQSAHNEESPDEESGAQAGKADATAALPAAPHEPRFLMSRAGRDRVRYYYVPASDHQLVIVDVVEGKTPRKARLAKLASKIALATSSEHAPSLKSHREYVAESTLGDPELAAQYARAREQAQFALAMIRLREAAKHTPESMAERTGLSRALILSVERGHIPKLGALRRLADALNARILITPGSGLVIEPAPVEAAFAGEPASVPESAAKPKPKSRPRATAPKPPTASKTPAAKANPKSVSNPPRAAQANEKPSQPRPASVRKRTAGKRGDAGADSDSASKPGGNAPGV